jgi:tRNA threonylcarbamoyl adenosine modification protein YeaZ
MKILALEFSSPQRSVAILRYAESRKLPGRTVQTVGGKFDASEVIETGASGIDPIGMIDRVLRQAEIAREQVDCIAIGLGPGSYNGIRLAIALAQGWQLAAGVKVLGISSAECIAAQAQDDYLSGRVTVVIDAQRGEFYVATYELTPELRQPIEPLRLARLEYIKQLESSNDCLVGPEVNKWFPQGRVVFPRAVALGKLAATRTDFIPGEKLEPIYLRETSFVKAPPPRVIPS